MKKMILKAAACAALATAMVLTGCSDGGAGDSYIIKTSGASGKSGTINETNVDSSSDLRGFQPISFKHTEVDCDIIIDDVETAGPSAMGLVFGLSEGEDSSSGEKTYSFYRIGVKPRQSTGTKPVWYVDYIKNVTSEKISNGDIDTNVYSTDVLKTKEIPGTVVTGKKLSVKISVKQAESGAVQFTLKDEFGTTVDSCTDSTARITYEERKVGYYAMVYHGFSLDGSWTITNTKAAEIVEE